MRWGAQGRCCNQALYWVCDRLHAHSRSAVCWGRPIVSSRAFELPTGRTIHAKVRKGGFAFALRFIPPACMEILEAAIIVGKAIIGTVRLAKAITISIIILVGA